MAKEDSRSYSGEEIDRLIAEGKAWPTRKNAPAIDLDESFWDLVERQLSSSQRKASVHLRIDPKVLSAFKEDGPGHLTRMAIVLRAYVEAKAKKAS
jgi:hypothetical protein